MADFKVNTEAFTRAINEYESAISEMNSIKERLTRKVQVLQDKSWQSKAGDKFCDKYNNKWAVEVDKYTKITELMISLLNEAKSRYEEIIDEANKISY